MPIIPARLQGSEWQPTLAWPADCSVQWGGHGIVLSRKGSYGTAFFEAFPGDGSAGFIRGEGETLDDAEQAAFSKWRKHHDCHAHGGHQWSRNRRFNNGTIQHYDNGGAFCLKCGAFRTALKPIVKLGEWKRPLEITELTWLKEGGGWPRRDQEPDAIRFARRHELRAKLYGIVLPDWRTYGEATREARKTYAADCAKSVLAYFVEHIYGKVDLTDEKSLMGSLFGKLEYDELRCEAIELGLIEEADVVG